MNLYLHLKGLQLLGRAYWPSDQNNANVTVSLHRVPKKNGRIGPAHTKPLFWKYFLYVQGVGTYLFMDFFDSGGFSILS